MFEIDISSPQYPQKLQDIPSPPKRLYAIGDISLLHRPSAAIVGTRSPSNEGKRQALLWGERRASEGKIVVSGLAKGVDSFGHLGCLKGGGKTIAVMAQGLDMAIYPSERAKLAALILERGGLLLSEQPPGTPVHPGRLVARNRIQSGLSESVIIVEMGIVSGTAHTVRFAWDQGREVQVVDLPAEGNQFLLGSTVPTIVETWSKSLSRRVKTKLASLEAVVQRLQPL